MTSLSSLKKHAEKLVAIKSIMLKAYTLKSRILQVWYLPSNQLFEKQLMNYEEFPLNAGDPQFGIDKSNVEKISSAHLINYKYYNYFRR